MPRGVRLNPEHDERTRAYIYRIERAGNVLYVGKGTGRRFETQSRRLGGDGGSAIIEYCKSETVAFKREREVIAELTPPLNACAGGNGGRARKRRARKPYKWEVVMNTYGTRAYAAALIAWAKAVL